MQRLQLPNIKTLQVANSLTSYLSCFPELSCLEITDYDGHKLQKLPASVRVLVARNLERCDFPGNVRLVQTKNGLSVHPSVQCEFS